MPLTLSLNTAARYVQFVLSRDGVLLCAQNWLTKGGGTELLAPALEHACRRMGFAARDIERVACVAGPGSFTGIRLALATAAGLARANGARQAGLNFMQCVAAGVPARPGESIAVFIPARRGWMYSAVYVADARGLPCPRQDIELLPQPDGPDDSGCAGDMRERGGPRRASHGAAGAPVSPCGSAPDYLVGEAVSAHRSFFEAAVPAGTRIMPARYDMPSAAALLALTEAADWNAAPRDVRPLYLRDCDAVDNLDDMARMRGEDPARARAELERLLSAGL
ncbi:MAG: tRNA (adenosine(37)-N6)-threonylcarbamoyltransferase complex dimerization subunit type 1 TsaB [Desulfovibrionaceae bacterium]|nr:tRNA (adenosine(37)-N6)-threonylcarbamoyltransferase complex dimerization subunit type 1 TsaB [Desulfovibrionaceae bacterium]